ncbi:Kinesin-like protein [Pseudocercospora fuligena]|uniref:Kinesin-like protein n=1 Tax=Pseudocercospora fuligena TaxID=685502 RepID=A0A8H6VHD2_9PEZI|nr:Kinesin-like protein [Pseudocercospora fuligena]
MANAADQAGASSINVCVRVRPFTIQEAAQLSRSDDGPVYLGEGSLASAPKPRVGQKGIRNVIKVLDEKTLIFDPQEDSAIQRFGRQLMAQGKKAKDSKFAFDHVFDDNATQNDVYQATAVRLLDRVLDGYNATILAYGATGCGKTHTITGTSAHPGIIYLAIQELFEKMEELRECKEVTITLSYLEIYNEQIRDLLVDDQVDENGKPVARQNLMLREDADHTVSVAGLTSHKPQDVDQVMQMIIQGNAKRTQSPTEANATSSRSHAVLQVNVASKDRNASVNEPVTFATLSIIDLAGSERASATKNRGARLTEGANINKSLLALGGCINALCDSKKKNHIPYRNSKLTRLLKFSLGGNCQTVMIVCVSPSSAHYDETQNTLRYANRAKNILTKSIRNVYNVDRHVKDYVKKIEEQRQLINELEAKLADGMNTAANKLRKAETKLEDIVREGVERIRAAYDHSAGERQERIKDTCRLRQIERRISAISAWVGAFDQVTETREEEEPPAALVSMRQTAVGILAELEHSRQHYHQKLQKNNWARAIETALQFALQQLQNNEAFHKGSCQEATVLKEVEILKQRSEIDIHIAVLEQEKVGEASLMQVMLTTQFETMAIINQLLHMGEEEAMQAGRDVMGKLMQACLDATGQIIKPDGGLQITQAVKPTKSGTPRKQKPLLGPSPLKQKVRTSISSRPSISGRASLSNPPPLSAVPTRIAEESHSSSPRVGSSPARGAYSSPKRRVKLGGLARKGVAFSGAGTPKKKSPQKKRTVRWKDEDAKDGEEPGTLVEFQPTPKMPQGTPTAVSTDDDSTKIEPPNFSAGFDADAEPMSSPLPAAPIPSSDLRKAGTGRFANGFLSKNSMINGSPMAPPPSLTLGSFSSEDESSPLRDIGANRAPQPGLRSITNQSTKDFDNGSASGSASGSDHYGSDVDASFTDKESAHQIRSAMARKKRSSSLGGNTADRLKARAERERRRSPTASTFTASSPPAESAFSAGQARRMVASGRDDPTSRGSVLSPRTHSIEKSSGTFARPMAIRQRQSMFDLNTPRETPTGPSGRPHSRASSIVPGSANRPKGPWR